MRLIAKLAIFAAMLWVCCVAQEPPAPLAVMLHNGAGKDVGKAVFTQTAQGVKLELSMHDFQPGKHGFHIHEKPICEGKEDFDTAGLRFDPTHEFYGDSAHKGHTGPSAGDPGQLIEIAADGNGHGTYVFPKLTMGSDDHSILRGDGTAIVFHSADNTEGPTRIACGVISRVR
ncbi:MAG TPA: superoxide dismutase family protein [Terracidiphilus sp.]|nr:superoxide dismutase family protein [Terracidiphilus sp.]